MEGIWRAVTERSTYQRWIYLILGGALSFPYVLVTFIVLPAVLPGVATPGQTLLLGVGVVLLFTVATTFLPVVRVLEGAAVRALLDDPLPDGIATTARDWPTRLRASAMFLLHVTLGAVLSLATLLLPVAVVSGFAAPFTGEIGLAASDPLRVPVGWASAWIPLMPLLGGVVLLHLARFVGGALRGAATVLLGVPMADRLAMLERQTERLMERNRLARELHDSVGHALSVINLQAGAARVGLEPGSERVEKALKVIESSCLAAMDDLDYVLGLLREDSAGTNPQPDLGQLPELLETTRLAGVPLDDQVIGATSALPATVSRQAYRIVQECLTNVLRHAGKVPVTLRLAVTDGRLELSVANPIDAARRTRDRSGGGQGLHGIAERVDILGGRFSAGRVGDQWEVSVSLSWEGTT